MTGVCSVIGGGDKTDIYTAMLVNGFAAHILELDDGHRVGAPHLEANIFSAMIAAAQKEKLTFERFAKGVIVGYEATIRLASSIQPGHKLRGFHSSGTCGTIGTAFAVGYAMGLSREKLKCAISVAATSSAGLLQVTDDESELKPYNIANAAISGTIAAYIGKCGFRSPEDVLGGKRGFFSALADEVKYELLVGEQPDLGIFQIYVKPFAACRHAHAAIECALNICQDHMIIPEDIKEVEIQIYSLAISGHDHVDVKNASSAKMSIPYSVAAAIVLGSCNIDAYTPSNINREDIRELSGKIHLHENSRLTSEYPGKRGSIVKIILSDGNTYEHEVEYPLGEPEHNITDDQLMLKYNELMNYAQVPDNEAKDISAAIWNLEDKFKDFLEMI